jgi:hypothetical protein
MEDGNQKKPEQTHSPRFQDSMKTIHSNEIKHYKFHPPLNDHSPSLSSLGSTIKQIQREPMHYWLTATMKPRYSTLIDLLERDVGMQMCLICEYAHP